MKFIFSVTLTSTCFKRRLWFRKKNILNSKSVPRDIKSCQSPKVPTSTKTSSSIIINDLFIARFIKRGVIDINLSDHQLIYCTRKISRIKRGLHKQIQFRSFKHHTVDIFEQELSKWNFPNYQNYNEITEAYNDFFRKLWARLIRSRQ